MRLFSILLAVALRAAAPESVSDAPLAGAGAESPAPPDQLAENNTEPEPAGADPEVTDGIAANAPEPTEANGVVEGDATGRKKALWVPRTLLFVPRLAVRAVGMPLRAGSFLYDRYSLPQRISDVVLMDDGKAGILPVAGFETGLRGRIGARFFHHDLFRHGERISARASFAASGEQQHRVRLSSGGLLPRGLALELVAQYWLLRNTRFFGIGNGDLESAPIPPPGEQIDPLQDDTAIATRFKDTSQTYEATFRWAFRPHWSWNVSSGVDHRSFSRQPRGTTGDQDTLRVYRADALVGVADGLLASNSRTGLSFNNLRTSRPWLSTATPSKGWRVDGSVGYTKGIDRDDPSNFVNWNASALRLFDVYRGDRVIALRVRAAGVTGPLDEVPVVRLPQLGGSELRGYPSLRFRDRITAFGTVEYRYPIGEAASGYLFFDFGRVYRSARDIELRKWRAGGGPGLVFHTRTAFLARLFFAASVDGSLFFKVSFDPLTQ